MAGDAAYRARHGHAVVAAYIAAHAAARVDGPDAMAAERAWQADWLRGALRADRIAARAALRPVDLRVGHAVRRGRTPRPAARPAASPRA